MFPSQVAEALNLLIDLRRPVFIWGAPGVGKSEVVAQVAAARGMMMRDVRLGLCDPTDIKGFPVPDLAQQLMRWLPANFLPPMMIEKTVTTGRGKTAKTTTELVPNDTTGILFLDEMNQAPPMVQTASYSLVLDRRIGDYVLPEGWVIVAAGNREGDRGNVQRQPTPLSLRFTHIDMEVCPKEWSEWATNKKVHYKTVAFLRLRPELLHDFDATKRSSPNPRGWVTASEYTDMPPSTRMNLIGGTVGESSTTEYLNFLDVYGQVPSIDEVRMNPDKTPIPEKMNARFAISSALSAHATPENFDSFMQYMGRFDTEWLVSFTRDAMVRNPNVTKTKAFQNFAIKNSNVLS